jgi:hypothetical protein
MMQAGTGTGFTTMNFATNGWNRNPNTIMPLEERLAYVYPNGRPYDYYNSYRDFLLQESYIKFFILIGGY